MAGKRSGSMGVASTNVIVVRRGRVMRDARSHDEIINERVIIRALSEQMLGPLHSLDRQIVE